MDVHFVKPDSTEISFAMKNLLNLPNIYSPLEKSLTFMSATIKQDCLRYDIEKNHSLKNRVFSGCLFDNELNLRENGYLFEYFLGVRSYRMEGDRCIIDSVDLCVGTKTEGQEKPVDLNKEIISLNKEAGKYEKLAKTNPSFKGSDGLSYAEVAIAYKQTAQQLSMAQQEVLNQAKLQIKDRINTSEDMHCRLIEINGVNNISFPKGKMRLGSIRWKQVS